MKVAVIGSRDFESYDLMSTVLGKYPITKIISGGAKGADKLSERYSKERGIETLIHIPNWETHGKSAGFIRNRLIVEDADMVIAFWDGESRGTNHSLALSNSINKKCIIIPFRTHKKKVNLLSETFKKEYDNNEYEPSEEERNKMLFFCMYFSHLHFHDCKIAFSEESIKLFLLTYEGRLLIPRMYKDYKGTTDYSSDLFLCSYQDENGYIPQPIEYKLKDLISSNIKNKF